MVYSEIGKALRGANMVRIMDFIAEKIEQKIKKSNRTQTEIALACGKTPGWLNNIIHRKSEIGILDLIKISEILECDITEFLPVPQKIDVEKMSLLDFIKYICQKEIKNYCDSCDTNNKMKPRR